MPPSNQVPAYDTTVIVRGEITLDRTLCINEIEAEQFLRARLNEELPLCVERIKVAHKDRTRGGESSVWESEFTLSGKVHIDKPLPREEIRKIVQDLVQKAGFQNPSVDVRKTDRTEEGNVKHEPSNRELADLASKTIQDRIPQRAAPISREEALRLKRGDRVVVSRLGIQEEAEVLQTDLEDQMVEVAVESYATPVWVPFGKIIEVIKNRAK
jgi:hypothetical protein